jgi:hypothetical protein
MTNRTIYRAIIAAVVLIAGCGAAAGQSTNAKPVIVMQEAGADPATLTMLGDDGRKALADTTAQLKAGTIADFVFSATANGATWDVMSADKAKFLNMEDLARQSFERCEFLSKVSCIIVSINGHDARDSNGGWPSQPRMLAQGTDRFDATRVPFISMANRAAMASYGWAAGPRAYVVTPSGNALWRSGKSIFDAISAARADCQKSFANQICVLYAVNDTVVMAQ